VISLINRTHAIPQTPILPKSDQELISILQDGADLSPKQAGTLEEVLNKRKK